MRFAIHAERIGRLLFVVGLAALAWQIAGLARGPRFGPPAAVPRAREQLDAAIAARYHGRHDEQFDAIVGALGAGVGQDTPEDLRAPLATIARGRSRERSAASANGGIVADCEVDFGLVLAARALSDAAPAERGAHVSDLVPTLAASGSMFIGFVLVLSMASVRQKERECIAELCDARGEAHDGRLAACVGRSLALARQAPERGPAVFGAEARGAPVPGPVGVDADDRPFDDAPFGRVLEIRASDDLSLDDLV